MHTVARMPFSHHDLSGAPHQLSTNQHGMQRRVSWYHGPGSLGDRHETANHVSADVHPASAYGCSLAPRILPAWLRTGSHQPIPGQHAMNHSFRHEHSQTSYGPVPSANQGRCARTDAPYGTLLSTLLILGQPARGTFAEALLILSPLSCLHVFALARATVGGSPCSAEFMACPPQCGVPSRLCQV
jgi:hypothetical protein